MHGESTLYLVLKSRGQQSFLVQLSFEHCQAKILLFVASLEGVHFVLQTFKENGDKLKIGDKQTITCTCDLP